MAAAHFAGVLAEAVDVLLTAAAGVALVRRRDVLATVALLLAADPLWSLAVQAAAAHFRLEATPARQIAGSVLAGAPLWAAFILGLIRVLGPEPPPHRPPAGVVER